MYSEFREEYFKHKQIVKISGVLKLLFENTYIFELFYCEKAQQTHFYLNVFCI